jgi:hypothetical protein
MRTADRARGEIGLALLCFVASLGGCGSGRLAGRPPSSSSADEPAGLSPVLGGGAPPPRHSVPSPAQAGVGSRRKTPRVRACVRACCCGCLDRRRRRRRRRLRLLLLLPTALPMLSRRQTKNDRPPRQHAHPAYASRRGGAAHTHGSSQDGAAPQRRLRLFAPRRSVEFVVIDMAASRESTSGTNYAIENLHCKNSRAEGGDPRDVKKKANVINKLSYRKLVTVILV